MLEELSYSSTPETRETLPQIAPSPDFRIGVHPRRWSVDLKMGRLVPDLVVIPCVPGFSEVERHGDITSLITAHEKDGWTMLHPDEYHKVEPGKPYVRKIAVGGGSAHVPRWTEPIPGTARSRVNREAYERFVRHVIALVPPPDAGIVKAGLRQAERTYTRHVVRAATNPLAKRDADEWARHVEIWQAALDGNFEPFAEPIEPEASEPTETAPKKGARKSTT